MTNDEFDQLWMVISLLPGVTSSADALRYKGKPPYLLYRTERPGDWFNRRIWIREQDSESASALNYTYNEALEIVLARIQAHAQEDDRR